MSFMSRDLSTGQCRTPGGQAAAQSWVVGKKQVAKKASNEKKPIAKSAAVKGASGTAVTAEGERRLCRESRAPTADMGAVVRWPPSTPPPRRAA